MASDKLEERTTYNKGIVQRVRVPAKLGGMEGGTVELGKEDGNKLPDCIDGRLR